MTRKKAENRESNKGSRADNASSLAPRPSHLVPPLLRWFAANARALPWRRTRDPYAVWVSEIMLQQTQVKTVIPYWERWMQALPDLAALAAAPPAQIHKLWEGLGYYTRVRNMQRAAQQMLAHHAGRFPEDFASVLALPGIGRYTAGAVCSIAFNQPAPILDGNVIRVLIRLFGIAGNPRDKSVNAHLWQLATALVQAAAQIPHSAFHIPHSTGPCSALHQSLMELGALVCTPRQPACGVCPLRARCVAHRDGLTAQLPHLAPRAKVTARRFLAVVVEHRGRFLVRQRAAGTVNAHLWEFPNLESADARPATVADFERHLGMALRRLEPLCAFKHSITRYRISVEAFRATLRSREEASGGTWLKLEEMTGLPFTSAHGTILRRINGQPVSRS